MTSFSANEWHPSRRELLTTALLGSSSMFLSGCSKRRTPPAGELLSPSFNIGHRIRDGEQFRPDADSWEKTSVVIVGGGIAGLSAGWRLQHAGYEDFRLLELEREPGGTSRSGTSPVTPYPWGAHYVPLPQTSNKALRILLKELGVFEEIEDGGDPVVAEHVLCREPQERLYVRGEWITGLYAHSVSSKEELHQWEAFQQEIKRWIDWRDSQGRPAFTIPLVSCSNEEEVIQFDKITMSEWLQKQGWTSVPLHRYIDYCCRDDYGLTIDQTSAWAGLFYFASRIDHSENGAQPLLTWPDGNGRIVSHLTGKLGSHVESGQAVVSIEPPPEGENDSTRVIVFDVNTQKTRGLLADHVIFAAPQFLAPHLIRRMPAQRKQAVDSFQYGAWIVANLHLTNRPSESTVPLCWDNVFYDSSSLGYVVATHQIGSDYGPTVWTWYAPLCDSLPENARRKLLDLSWDHWAEFIISDLEVAHPDIRKFIERLDVMRWGHAMIQPRPGFVWSKQRQQAAEPLGAIHFAGTDLSGVALMEEAFYHGLRAAEEVLNDSGIIFTSYL